MSEYTPYSSSEYAADQRRRLLGPHPCEIKSIEWHSGKNLMIIFIWGGSTRSTNVSHYFRRELGKLTKDVRDSIIEHAPKQITISTRSIGYEANKRRYLHDASPNELAEWLARIKE